MPDDPRLRINKDTKLCTSLASRPGNFATRLHNFLYAAMGLNFLYKSFTTRDLKSAIAGIRVLAIRGCAISMPFKEIISVGLRYLRQPAIAIFLSQRATSLRVPRYEGDRPATYIVQSGDDRLILINASSVGMFPDRRGCPFSEKHIADAQLVIDAVVNPVQTRLIRAAATIEKAFVTGFDITVIQSIEQFHMYTGTLPDDATLKAARDFVQASV